MKLYSIYWKDCFVDVVQSLREAIVLAKKCDTEHEGPYHCQITLLDKRGKETTISSKLYMKNSQWI